MHNPYKNIRYFPQANKYAVMDSERKEADILSIWATLEAAMDARDKN